MSTSKNCIRGTHCNSKQQFPKENTSPKTGRPKYSHPTRSCRKPICFDMFLKHRRYAHHIFSKLNDISARFNNSALGSTSFWIWNGLLIWTHSVWTLHHEDIVCGKKLLFAHAWWLKIGQTRRRGKTCRTVGVSIVCASARFLVDIYSRKNSYKNTLTCT